MNEAHPDCIGPIDPRAARAGGTLETNPQCGSFWLGASPWHGSAPACEGQRQLRPVALGVTRIIPQADVAHRGRLRGSVKRAEKTVPRREEEAEIDVAVAFPAHVMQAM